jgi:hypothetical protein
MNKEQQELVNEAYKNYLKHNDEVSNYWIKKNPKIESRWKPYSQEEFINKCQTDKGFSEKWGLEIEERELSTHERLEWVKMNLPNIDVNGFVNNDEYSHKCIETLNDNIPTKLITVTYNDKTIESYE